MHLPRANRWASLSFILFATLLISIFAASAQAATLSRLLAQEKIELSEVYPGADRLGTPAGSPLVAPVYKDGEQVGALFVNSDVANAAGYSGKPIHVAIGLSRDGVVKGVQLVEHSEPIVLIGIPEEEVQAFIDGYEGRNLVEEMQTAGSAPAEVDIISGATVTVMVIDDSIRRAVVKVAQALGYGGLEGSGSSGPARRLVGGEAETLDWTALTGSGAVRRLSLDVGDVTRTFEQTGNPEAAKRPESDDPRTRFIDLYAGLASIPTVAKSLMGAREYRNFAPQLEEGRDALIIGARGLYSFKGSGYVRGGVFDRIQIIQDQTTVRFRDDNHKRLADIDAEGAPSLDEVGLFLIPEDSDFDPAEPWRLELLIQRNIGGRDKAFTTVALSYTPPDRYVEASPASTEGATGGAPDAAEPGLSSFENPSERDALWQRMWQRRIVDIAILLVMLFVLTLMFFFQDQLVRRPRFATWLRYGFLAVVLVWMGFYANAQLSVVNILTFSNALLTDFRWAYFLMDPLIFILWFGVAAGLVFWGRGAFCGWLCPFGALQEITNHIGRRFGIPQVKVPWGLNERLWPIKYIIFMGLLGLSLYSLSLAETLSEIEPFKTAIIMNFIRSWPFVAFAIGLLVVNLFIERFFCRYLCPLGAALAIPARIRMFDWLKRHKQCGDPCQICAHECPVDAIHPTGEINPNECIYCLDCQKLYYDDQRCPPMIQKRVSREKRLLASSDRMLSPESLAEKRRLQAQQQEEAELKGNRRTSPEV